MKAAVLGVLTGAGLVFAALGASDHHGEACAQRVVPPHTVPSGGDLIVLPMPGAEKAQQLVVVDPKLRAMSVYQIDPLSGKIALRSVRNIHWDLQVTHLNNESPLPEEIRALLQQR